MMVLIFQIVSMLLVLGFFLNTLNQPFIKITSTTTLTDCSGGLSGFPPGNGIVWVDPFTGIQKGAFVKAITDRARVTIGKPFIVHDEIAPWPPNRYAPSPDGNAPTFDDFAKKTLKGVLMSLSLPPHHLGIGRQYRGRHYRRNAPDLTIIYGGLNEKS